MLALFVYVSFSALDQLGVKGTHLVGSSGQTVVLKGVSLFWHQWALDFYQESVIQQAKTFWNAKVVRASIGVEKDDGLLEQKQLAYDTADKVIKAAISQGVYVILDFHAHDLHTDEASEFFEYFASKYAGNTNIIYELYNEPMNVEWSSQIKPYAIKLINIIRKYDKSNVIIVGCRQWDQQIEEPANDPITGQTNIAYTLHFYAGTHKWWLREQADRAIALGLSLFISEWGGMDASGDGPIDQEETALWVKWMDDNQLSWATWSLNNKDEGASHLLPTVSATKTWTDSDLSTWGKYVKNLLK